MKTKMECKGVPDRHGQTEYFKCTECRKFIVMPCKMTECEYNFCPWCGAEISKEGSHEIGT